MKTINKKSTVFFLVILFLLLLRSDFRFIEKPLCCGDDHDYYSHAESLVIDYDFDYSNQLEGFEKKRYNKNNKIAPKGFIGTGILSSPFLFLGSIIDNISDSLFSTDPNGLMNYKVLLYSLSSVFYFFLSIFLIYEVLKILKVDENFYFILLIFLGSGLPYFAFERYSMTHVYEVFTTSLIAFLSVSFYSEKNNNKKFYSFLIPLGVLMSLLVRWTNYYVVLLPLIIKLLFPNKLNNSKKLITEVNFYISIIFSTIVFVFLNYKVYGIATINPVLIYGDASKKLDIFLNSINNFPLFLENNFLYLFQILFGKEFGIFWFSPVIFISCLYVWIIIFTKKNKLLLKILLFLSFGQVFSTVFIWASTASSYGYRYLYSLIPLSLFIHYSDSIKNKYSITKYYLIIFSVFGFLGILFFETSETTALQEAINSFGNLEPYTQPNYLLGLFSSFFSFSSYLIIFTTSYLGAIVFKALLMIFSIDNLNSFLGGIGLPVENQDFQNLLIELSKISIDKFIFTSLLVYYISKKINLKANKVNRIYE